MCFRHAAAITAAGFPSSSPVPHACLRSAFRGSPNDFYVSCLRRLLCSFCVSVCCACPWWHRLFIDWYLCEERINDLKAFLDKTFPGAGTSITGNGTYRICLTKVLYPLFDPEYVVPYIRWSNAETFSETRGCRRCFRENEKNALNASPLFRANQCLSFALVFFLALFAVALVSPRSRFTAVAIGLVIAMDIDVSELVERPTLYSGRYKIPHQDGMNLADVFGHFEAAKAKVCAISRRCTRKRQRLSRRFRHAFLFTELNFFDGLLPYSERSRVRGEPAMQQFYCQRWQYYARPADCSDRDRSAAARCRACRGLAILVEHAPSFLPARGAYGTTQGSVLCVDDPRVAVAFLVAAVALPASPVVSRRVCLCCSWGWPPTLSDRRPWSRFSTALPLARTTPRSC